MKIFLSYFISVVIIPIVVIFMLSQFLPNVFQRSIAGIIFQTALAGFISVWLGTRSFSLIGLQPAPLIVFLIGFFFFLNYLFAYDFKDTGPLLYNATLLGAAGSLSGVMIGGLYFF